MSGDDRTQEQKDADLAFEEAMQRVVQAYRLVEVEMPTMDHFVVIGRATGLRGEGVVRSYFKVLPRGGILLDWDTAIGMCYRGASELEREYHEED